MSVWGIQHALRGIQHALRGIQPALRGIQQAALLGPCYIKAVSVRPVTDCEPQSKLLVSFNKAKRGDLLSLHEADDDVIS